MIITDRKAALEVVERCRTAGASLAMFCTASDWNTEAILRACQRLGRKLGVEKIPVIVGMTGSYRHMPQCKRVTASGDLKAGFLTLMGSLHALAGAKDAPYYDVTVLPQLDHGDPVGDRWILTEGIAYLSGVMFDAQAYSREENIELTAAYMKAYGRQVTVEAAMEALAVQGGGAGYADRDDAYAEHAADYAARTGVDFLVADLGTEQQSAGQKAVYRKDRARAMTGALGRDMLVLHGVSSLTDGQISGLADDGVVKVNMWTRIVREAGRHAAACLRARGERMEAGEFEACDPRTFLSDCIEKAADICEKQMVLFQYGKLV